MGELRVRFPDSVEDSLFRYAVIVSRSEGKWVFCKHKERDTLEVPGGHRENGETIGQTARRELEEETGALEYSITPVCPYSVVSEQETFGMIFYAEINAFEQELYSEIERVFLLENLPEKECLTYPLIQPKLVEEVRRRGFC